MISDFDRTIERLLQEEFRATLPFDLSFARPNKDFAPLSPDKSTLNCYLYDIGEDRELRRVAPFVERGPDGMVITTPAPPRIKLSYCITAWSPAADTPAISPEMDEHQLLSQVLTALLKYPELPTDVLVGSLAGQEPPLPTSVIRPNDKRSTSEFWNAIGGELRPSLDYCVTISLVVADTIEEHMVTTRIATYDHLPASGMAEEWIEIGGFVTATDGDEIKPVPDAWVLLVEKGRTDISDEDGRFSFQRLRRGGHTLRVRADGYLEDERPITVPSPSGDSYDVQLTAVSY